MNNDILPTPRPPRPSVPQARRSATPLDRLGPAAQRAEIPLQPIGEEEDTPTPPKRSKKRLILSIATGLAALIIIVAGVAYVWYAQQLQPVNSQDAATKRIEVVSGMNARNVGDMLEQNKLIRSSDAFYIYTYLHGDRDRLKAGVYNLTPSEDTGSIIRHLVSGKVEEASITFYPGGTLYDLRTNKNAKASDVTSLLKQAGYSEQAITAALSKQYSSPIFDGKPSTVPLEGFVYGDTYTYDAGATPSDILQRSFDEFAQVVEDNDLVAKYQKQGLTLYQGITLASIIQREVASTTDKKPTRDQQIVAQIFLLRYKSGMPLGSDVTYQYAAAMRGVEPTPELDSPYNTRKFPGLPPGPIASPGIGALLAVADPATTDYVYFLSGDDDKTYFAHTDAEHQANITAHCQQKCSVF